MNDKDLSNQHTKIIDNFSEQGSSQVDVHFKAARAETLEGGEASNNPGTQPVLSVELPTAIIQVGREEAKGSIKEILEKVLTEEQRSLIKTETAIGKITLDEDGKIVIPDTIDITDVEVQRWQAKQGVLDVKKYGGVLTVVYNSSEHIPDGCPNQMFEADGREGQYDAFTNIAYIDVANTWDFLNDKFQPSWKQMHIRHEIRHGIVSQADEKRYRNTGSELRRVIDQDILRDTDPELTKQLGYLDELHSQFFDVVDGEIEGTESFTSINSSFYTLEDTGSHVEVASLTSEGKNITKDLFSYLQGLLLLKRINEKYLTNRDDVNDLIRGAGTVLATERTLIEANNKVKALWQAVKQDPDLARNFNHYVDFIKPSSSMKENTPILTNELRNTLLGGNTSE